jgi:hypothetical protein
MVHWERQAQRLGALFHIGSASRMVAAIKEIEGGGVRLLLVVYEGRKARMALQACLLQD